VNTALVDGDFEQDPTLISAYWGWQGGAGIVQTGTFRSASHAMKLSNSTLTTVSLRSAVGNPMPTTGRDYCGEAWVMASASAGPLTLVMGRYVGSTELGLPSPEGSVMPDGGWQRLTYRYFYPTMSGSLVVQVSAPLDGGEAFVDDVCVQVCP
jgi:hypothetical protein